MKELFNPGYHDCFGRFSDWKPACSLALAVLHAHRGRVLANLPFLHVDMSQDEVSCEGLVHPAIALLFEEPLEEGLQMCGTVMRGRPRQAIVAPLDQVRAISPDLFGSDPAEGLAGKEGFKIPDGSEVSVERLGVRGGGADGPDIQPSPGSTRVAMTAKTALRDIASARSCIAESSRIVAFTDT